MNEKHVAMLSDTLAELHTKGFVHGDIYEGNIFYVNEDEALLVDWSHVTEGNSQRDRDNDFIRLGKTISSLTPSEMYFELCTAFLRAKRPRE